MLCFPTIAFRCIGQSSSKLDGAVMLKDAAVIGKAVNQPSRTNNQEQDRPRNIRFISWVSIFQSHGVTCWQFQLLREQSSHEG